LRFFFSDFHPHLRLLQGVPLSSSDKGQGGRASQSLLPDPGVTLDMLRQVAGVPFAAHKQAAACSSVAPAATCQPNVGKSGPSRRGACLPHHRQQRQPLSLPPFPTAATRRPDVRSKAHEAIPVAEGLFNPANDKDACGVGFVGELNKVPTRKCVMDSLTM